MQTAIADACRMLCSSAKREMILAYCCSVQARQAAGGCCSCSCWYLGIMPALLVDMTSHTTSVLQTGSQWLVNNYALLCTCCIQCCKCIFHSLTCLPSAAAATELSAQHACMRQVVLLAVLQLRQEASADKATARHMQASLPCCRCWRRSLVKV